MNFQAVSVGQKLSVEQILSAPLLQGGYVKDMDERLVPGDGLQATLEHTDESIGAMVSALGKEELLDSTMIIISAKHGNSPVNPLALVRVNPTVISGIVNSVAPGLALLSADTGPLIWLKDQTKTAEVVAALDQPANRAAARIDHILWGDELKTFFPDPLTDSRTPDIILIPESGTVYTTSLTKIADHGGSGEDDVHVALLVSQRSLQRNTVSDAVETRQIACTILTALALSCDRLESQQIEPSTFLPRSNRKSGVSVQTQGITSVKRKR